MAFALPLFAATLFVSAFILFLVQPMIGKLILPKLGGTPQVWNTCMVFFQMVLLAGYAYTHTVSTRLKLRHQLILHAILLFTPFLVLGILRPPFYVADWVPDLGVNPIPSALMILITIVGLPFLIVSTSAPLLQKWFVHTGHPAAKDPYFLYGASNLGSMLALLFYPTLLEPNFRLETQTWIWTVGYAMLVLFVMSCVALVWGPSSRDTSIPDSSVPDLPPNIAPEKPAELPETGVTAKAPMASAVRAGEPALAPSVALPEGESITMLRRLKWIALAAIPSSMMLGITTHITTDLSPVPMIWLIPLTLYLLSFILVFARWPVVWTEEPHKIMVYIQPVAIAFMLISDFMQVGHSYLKLAIFFDVLGFFFTTMVCHGELAKDRPSTRFLTEFYLMMSVGGMLGGMFNALFAPNIPYLFEFPAAIIAAAFMRPWLKDSGWIDQLVAGAIDPTATEGAKKVKGPKVVAKAGVTPNLALTLDVVLGVAVGILSLIMLMVFYNPREPTTGSLAMAYTIPLGLSCLFLFRPIRYGTAIALIILVAAYQNSRTDSSDFRTRGYFGLIKVGNQQERAGDRKVYRQMIHGHINHGMNFLKPKDPKEIGDPTKDFSRLATTYYHRYGPAGIVMEQFNWFKEPENHFNSDSRIAASLLASGAVPFGALLPLDQISSLWSEPPFATIGLGTGTMASYARPYQHMHFYEIDNLVRRLSLHKSWKPDITYIDIEGKEAPQFNYLRDALARGAHLQVLMGDARLRMDLPYKSHYEDPELGGGPEGFYHMMVVDAFSSDAIPAHLITKQGIEMYFKHLTEKGILCVHTSNRFVDLPLVVGDVAASMGYAAKIGKDSAPYDKAGHFTSEWVMVARKAEYLRGLTEPPGYRAAANAQAKREQRQQSGPYWVPTESNNGKYLWTDDFYNILQVLR